MYRLLHSDNEKFKYDMQNNEINLFHVNLNTFGNIKY